MHQVMRMGHKQSGYRPPEQDRRLPALGIAFLLGGAGGSLACARLEWLRETLEQGSGVVLNTSSMVGRDGSPAGVAYPTSKFAVNGLTLSLARELGPKGIRVNAVAPGITETDMMKAVPKEVIDPLIAQIPLRRLGQPEDIANAFVFLASDYASYITGVVLQVDGLAKT